MKTGLWQGSLLFGIAIVGLSGCKTPPYCEELGNCGGTFILGGDGDFRKADGLKDHEWTIRGQLHGELQGTFCQDQLQVPPVPLSLLRQPPVQSTDRPPDKVTADWCSNIVFKASGDISRFLVWTPPIPLRVGQLVMSEDHDHNPRRGTYSMQITYAQTRQVEFSETCLTSQGIRLQCPEVGRHIGAFLAVEANIYSFRCFPPENGGGGCECLYELTFIGGPNGRWDASDDTRPGQVTFFDDLFSPPVRTDYCIDQDNKLQLTGHDDQALFNAKSYRTMELSPPTCDDGIQSASLGETGVDCGGPVCPNACGTCADGMHNNNEEGIDCGGACLGILCDPNPAIPIAEKKPACGNGVKEIWEEGTDCGGPCRALCTQ